MFSSLSLSTPAARCSPAGFYSVGRSSITRASISRFSIEQVLQSPRTRARPTITLSDLVLDCLRQLTIDFDQLDQEERNEAWKVVDCLLSAQSEQEIEDTIKRIAENFSHESHLKAIIISATNSVIVEYMLQEAHDAKTTEVSRLSYWKAVKINSIEAVQRAAEERELHLGDIETITTSSIVELTCTTGKEAALHPFLGYLDTYLKFKLAQENLAETIFEFCGDKAQLAEYLENIQNMDLPKEFDSISVESYVTASLEKRTKEEACKDLKEKFRERLSELKVVDYLTEADPRELRTYLAQLTEDIIALDYVFEDKVGEVEHSSQDVRHFIEQHRLAKNQGNPASVTKKILRSPLDLLKRDEENCTALDYALQLAAKSKNPDLVKRVLERAQDDNCVDEFVACSVEKMLDHDGNIHDLPSMFYLVIQGKCLFDDDFVTYIRDEDEASDEDGCSRLVGRGGADTSFVDDESPGQSDEYSSATVDLKFSKLFDAENHFISSPEFIDYAIQHADAETFQLLLNNILSQHQSATRQDILSDYLRRAVEFGHYAHIAKILTFAAKYKCATLIMREALFAVRENEEQLKSLMAGTYLFEPKDGGLFNKVFFLRVCSPAYVLASEIMMDTPMSGVSMSTMSTMSTSTMPRAHNNQKAQKEHEALWIKLTNLPLEDVSQKLLTFADDEVLAQFIQKAGDSSWPHNTQNRAQDIRRELEKRYIGVGKPALPPQVKAALQKNWDVKQDADKLATYYDTATRHIVEQYQPDLPLYKAKADNISSCLKDIVTGPGDTVDTKASHLANELLQPNQAIKDRRPRFLPDPHTHNRTQRLVNAAREALGKKPSMWNTAKRRIGSVVDAVMGWNHQRSKEILEQPNIQLGDFLSTEQLYAIPITQQEKETCVERTVLARGAFKKTLDYLEKSSNGQKLETMKTYLQYFIDGYDATGKAYAKDHLETDIRQASEKNGVLGARKFLSNMLWLSPSKTGRTATADLEKFKNMASAMAS